MLYDVCRHRYSECVGSTLCRFINADDTGYLGVGGAFSSYNLFAYCGNNPVNRADPTGELFGSFMAVVAVGAVVGAALGAFSAVTTGGNVLESSIEGALTGAASAVIGLYGFSFAWGLAAGAVIDMGVQLASHQIEQGYIDLENDFKSIDYVRVCETAVTTAASCAIPAFGEPAERTVDAFCTALIWGEGSALITVADVAVRKISSSARNYQRQKVFSAMEKQNDLLLV